MTLHELHYTTLQLQLHYFTQHYTRLHYNIPHYTTTTTTLITPHHNYNCNCNYTTVTTLHYSYNSTTLHHNYSYNCATPNYIQQLWWGDHCNHCNYSKNHSSNHLSVHQWIYSAICDSQQPTSPTGHLFLKLPPRPCAVLLVISTTLEGMDFLSQTGRCAILDSYSTRSWTESGRFANVRMMILWERRDRPNWDALAAVLSDGFTGTPYISQISLFSLADLEFLDQFFPFQSISNVFQLFLEQNNSFFSLPHIFPTVFFRSWSWARTYGRRRTAMTRLCHRCIPTPRWSAPRSTSPQSRQAGRSPMR